MRIIISQTGRRYNFDNVITYDVVGEEDFGQILCKLTNNDLCILGEYNSYERAEEVIKEIDNCYKCSQFYSTEQPYEHIMAMNTAPKIFKMPDE